MKTAARIAVALVIALAAFIAFPGRVPRERADPVPGPAKSSASVAVSSRTRFASCSVGARQGSVGYTNAEVEPSGAVNPLNRANAVATWQQDRWSDGGARALPVARSEDGGATWIGPSSTSGPRVTVCSGGTPVNGGDYERASDPWLSFAPNGDLYHASLSFNRSNDRNAVLISKSTDGGKMWSDPVTVKKDAKAFNDKETVTADPLTGPNDSRSKAYAVWSRDGDAWFSRTTDGTSWDRPRRIFKQGFTVGHQVAVHRSGRLIDIFTWFKSERETYIAVMRSIDGGADRGDAWSDVTVVSRIRFASPEDPDTGRKIRSGEGIPEIAADLRTGHLYAVWQDLLFESEGRRYSGIAFSVSRDEGRTWSKPVRINQPRAIPRYANDQAFTPSLDVAVDGTVGVSYYDFRQNTEVESVSTDYWLVRCAARSVSCTDRRNWHEAHVAGPFDIEIAPRSMGLFLGDYMAMAASGRRFVMFFVQGTVQVANRTNVYARKL